jgi:ABC-2 type transport system ATP-binding protein
VNTPPPAIEVAGLRKSYGDKVVLDDIDLNVPAGTIFSLLGPNGAGKTTAVSILSTLILADGGQVRVSGHDIANEPDAVRSSISVTGQFSAVDNLLTGEENLIMMSDLLHLGRRTGKRRAAELLEKFDLVAAGKKRAQTYSGGMRRRLDLAMTLVGEPRVIFLDEPTTGLDPRSRHTMWQIVRDLVAGGVTIFLTTQHLEEADQLADRIVIIDKGAVIAEGTSAELKQRVGGRVCVVELADRVALPAAAGVLERCAEGGAVSATASPPRVSVVTADGAATLATIVRAFDEARVAVSDISLRQPSLDDVFLALTGSSDAAVKTS